MIKENKVLKELKGGQIISIISLVDALIEEAHELRSSDIHIDPRENEVKIRLRIDGMLQDVYEFPKDIQQEVVTRIKVLAGIRTDEHQTGQDGRFRVISEHMGAIDVRVSIAPTYYGENAVLRLLSDRAEKFTLDTLGFRTEDMEKIDHAMRKPYGMILATGPTGSGKTTTLYTILKALHTPGVSIITIEDPIEYAINDIIQMQVNSKTGLSFANGLRSILRQDPDIIMVGEIRDGETAGLAVNTALTGHLVLSSLHTNDAATTLPRLLDLGIEPYLITATVNVIIAQRLVRKICEKCKIKHVFTKYELKYLDRISGKTSFDKDAQTYRGQGCDDCNYSGYFGRIGIYEVFEMDETVREAMLKRSSAFEIKKTAIARGMKTMVDDGFDKVKEGITTVEEVLRVIHE
ncbi:type II/IV secretion system protein [Candidatus Giovannonibacteria bacterium]|nr:type II/IV secretion system protein [Candidatus Giovannonibacteria bacterium]